jgi:hypothetical protein
MFDTKVAIVVLDDLAVWQKLNVTAFLATGIAGAAPEAMGEPYEDAAGRLHARLLGQPILVFAAGAEGLAGAGVAGGTRAGVGSRGLCADDVRDRARCGEPGGVQG